MLKETNSVTKGTIVISAINIRAGGPLTILKECLRELSNSNINSEYHVVALVHSKQDCLYNNITYYEFPKSSNRFYTYYMEFLGLKKLSKILKPVLWLSLSDKTPNVESRAQAVYLHNPTPFFRIKINDFIYSPFLLLYVLFYKKICGINIHKNNYLIVQQEWLRTAFASMYNFEKINCIVFPPYKKENNPSQLEHDVPSASVTFLFASLPRGFKNFEVICEANKILLSRGLKDFKIYLTLRGNESRYARDIVKRYGSMENISFIGVVPLEMLKTYYAKCDCLIFPSRLETWGLPISEFSAYNKPMLLADLPYAHNTAAGSNKVAFFDPYDPLELAGYMEKILKRDYTFLHQASNPLIDKPYTSSWEETINLLLNRSVK